MSWSSIFSDSHFSGASWVLPIDQTDQTTQDLSNITLSPLNFVTDVDPVGYTYHKLVFPDINTYTVPVLQDDEIDVEELIDHVREADLNDYYSLLFVHQKPFSKVTPDDVQKTWKLINLYLHPDKADSSRKAEAEIRYKACQRAFETLTDPNLKVDYDSSITFDDSVPGPNAGTKSLSDFLSVYKPVFERNERWSKIQPVPTIGDENTNEDDLTKFYKFWLGFSSWRTFPQADTEKCGDSASRDERRRAEKKNENARSAMKAKDTARLRTFVQKAQDIDPRMKVFKQQRLEREKAAKQAAYDAKQNKTGQNKPAVPVVVVQTVPQPAQTVEQKQAEFIQMVRVKLHGALTNDKYYVVNVEKRPQIPIMVDKIIGDYESCKKLDDVLMVNGYTDLYGVNGRRILEIEQVVKVLDELEGRVHEVKDKADKNVWSAQEEKALNESLIKFPVGTKDRYGKVTIQVNLVNGTHKRVEKEIIRKVKELELIRQVGMEQYKLMKAQAMGQVPEPTPAVVKKEEEKAVVENVSPQSEKKEEKKEEKKDKKDKKDDKKEKKDKKDDAQKAPVAIVWSADEQKLLEKGLTTVPKTVEDRWAKISAVVQTKTAQQCEDRFNFLREQIAAKKAAAAAATNAL
jgi:DnaJ family protein C protein 2